MDVIEHQQNAIFFVDGPGGMENIFLYHALIVNLRSKGQIVLATTTLFSRGQATHAKFKIPIDIEPSSLCSISKQSDTIKLIRQSPTII